MLKHKRSKLILFSLIALLTAAAAWIYTRQSERADIAGYVPESALAYLEINDLPQLINQITSTRAWQQIAPAYGVADKLNNLGRAKQLGWLASLTGNGEAAVFSQAQIAIAVTGLEARGEAIKPRFALILLARGNEKGLRSLRENRLPELALSLFGQASRELVEQAGMPAEVYRDSSNSQRELFSAQVQDVWILSNNADSLRDCLMTIQKRQPAMTNNFYLQKTRPEIFKAAGDGAPGIFGFVTADGVKRLMRFGTYVASGGIVSKAALAGAIGDVFTEFSNRTCDGLAYSSGLQKGLVVDRYSILFKPELTDKLKSAVRVRDGQPESLNLIPATAREVTIYNVVNPSQTIDQIEKSISARIDVAQSFLLHQFMLGMREAAFGAKSSELISAAVGNEIASFNLTKDPLNRVWLIAARDRTMLARLAENVLTQFQDKRIASIERETVDGLEILNSSEAFRGSALFIGDYLALGNRQQLLQLIEARRTGQSLKTARGLRLPDGQRQFSPLISFSNSREEANEMMVSLARWFGLQVIPAKVPALDELAFTVSSTSLDENGILIETHSPFGNFPYLISLANGTNNRSE